MVKFVHIEQLHHHDHHKCYVGKQNRYATHSVCQSARQKDATRQCYGDSDGVVRC